MESVITVDFLTKGDESIGRCQWLSQAKGYLDEIQPKIVDSIRWNARPSSPVTTGPM